MTTFNSFTEHYTKEIKKQNPEGDRFKFILSPEQIQAWKIDDYHSKYSKVNYVLISEGITNMDSRSIHRREVIYSKVNHDCVFYKK